MPTNAFRLHEAFSDAHPLAARHCRKHQLPWFDQEDVTQDLILDLLGRARHHDPARSSFSTFATICFRHRVLRLEQVAKRERRHRHPLSFDAPLPGDRTTTLADTLANDDGLSAWLGQDADPVEQFERHLDLDRALSAMPPSVVPLCAALLQSGPDRTDASTSRTTLHRRVRELRLQLLTAGVGGGRGTKRGGRG